MPRKPVDPQLDMMRHSTSHLMAAAIQKLWPEAQFGVGPSTKTGFYYDIDVPVTLGPEELKRIEKEMRDMRKQKLRFERREVPIEEAIDLMASTGQTLKVELLRLLKEKGTTAVVKETGDDSMLEVKPGASTVSLYQTGSFVDLCRGPHVASSADTAAFKLMSVSGAYWRGDAKNKSLQRIHAVAMATQAELDAELARLEEAQRRDHRKLGRELGLFTVVDEVGAGLPFWLPKGAVLRRELERLATEYERADGYVPVSTPVIAKEDLYKKSGHLPYYAEDMYAPIDIEGQKYYLRPMNCPHHHLLYASARRSYRELPLRLAEYGLCHRFEHSGVLSGLMRVRGFTQNDAHIYCRYSQAKDEFVRVMKLHARYYELFDITESYMRFSKPDLERLDKYVNEPQKWIAAMDIIRAAMEESGLPYVESDGEAAFYGPKIDFIIESVVGNEYAISTNQLDFLASERFDLGYAAEDDSMQPVYVIHRAPLGSHERFTAFLIEHYAGAFPTWLAPVQVCVLSVAERHAPRVLEIRDKLFQADIFTATGGLRVEADVTNERLQKKIRNAQLQKIPYILVVGDTEVESGAVSVRLRSGDSLGVISVDALLERLRGEIRTRRDTPKA